MDNVIIIPRRRSNTQSSYVAPTYDPNWYQKWQWGGTNPSVVMDFVNGLYWNGSATTQSASVPSALLTNGQLAAGGLDTTSANSNADNMQAAGALLNAFQGGEWTATFGLTGYTAQGSGYNCFTCAASNISTPTDQYLIMASGADECFTASGSHTLGPAGSTTPTSSLSDHGVSTNTSGTARGLCLCGTGIGAGNVSPDTFPFASNPSIVFIGGLSTGFSGYTLNGYLRYLSVINGQAPTTRMFAIPAFTGPNAWWWNGVQTNAGAQIDYGNPAAILFDYTQPWTMIAAVKLVAGPTSNHNTPNGIIFTNVKNSPFPGFEVWPDGLNVIHVRLINNYTTNVYLGVYGSTNLLDEQWHIVAVTYDGSGVAAGVNIYIDGVLETMTTEIDALGGNSIIGSSGNNDFIIANQYNSNIALQGVLGLFELHNLVLSLSTIQQYTTNIFYQNKLRPPILGSCVLAPKLSEGGSNTTTGDLSASNLTGTLASTNNWLRG